MGGGCGDRLTRVVAALIEIDGRLLITQRGADSVRGGMWEFPGGKVELGESLEEALRREIREELSLDLANDLSFIGWSDFDFGDAMINLFGYVCHLQDESKLKLDENRRLELPSEIKIHLLTPPDQHLLEVYIKKQAEKA